MRKRIGKPSIPQLIVAAVLVIAGDERECEPTEYGPNRPGGRPGG
jgi:hypothetical protein